MLRTDHFFPPNLNYDQSTIDTLSTKLDTICLLEKDLNNYKKKYKELKNKEDEQLAAAEKLKKEQENAQLEKAKKIQQLLVIIQDFHDRQAYQQALAHVENIDQQQRNLYLYALAARMEELLNNDGSLQANDKENQFHDTLLSLYEKLVPERNSLIYVKRCQAAIEALSAAILQETDLTAVKDLQIRRLKLYIKAYLYCSDMKECSVNEETLVYLLTNPDKCGIETEKVRGKSFEEILAYLSVEMATEKKTNLQLQNLIASKLVETKGPEKLVEENIRLSKEIALCNQVISYVKQENEKLKIDKNQLTLTSAKTLTEKHAEIEQLKQQNGELLKSNEKLENEIKEKSDALSTARASISLQIDTIKQLQKEAVSLKTNDQILGKEITRQISRNAELLTEQQKLTNQLQAKELQQQQNLKSILDQIQRDIFDGGRNWHVSWAGGHRVRFIEEGHSNKYIKVSNTAKEIVDAIDVLAKQLKNNAANEGHVINECRDKILNYLYKGSHRSKLYCFFHQQTAATKKRYEEYKTLLCK